MEMQMQMEMPMEMEMEILEALGEGSFGTVHRVWVPGEQQELPQPRKGGGCFQVDFEEEGDAWKSLSVSAHNLMQGMLCPDPQLRLTLPHLLCNPWVLLRGNARSLLNIQPTTATSTISALPPLSASPAAARRQALGCPPGFEKVPFKNNANQTKAAAAACLESTICGYINRLAVIEDKHVASLRRSLNVPMKMNGCHQSTINNKGAPSAIYNDKQLAANSPRRPPGFKAPMKTYEMPAF